MQHYRKKGHRKLEAIKKEVKQKRDKNGKRIKEEDFSHKSVVTRSRPKFLAA